MAEAQEQQAATAEILRVISRSRTDVRPVFDTIVNSAMKLCSASWANVFTFDGKQIHLAASMNLNPEHAKTLQTMFPRPPSRDMAVTRAILDRRVVAIPDVLEDSEYAVRVQSVAGGFQSVLALPLMREGSPIGAIAVGRPKPGAFPDKQVALLLTFAEQAVIAIENTRLFNEVQSRNRNLSEALEQQTATSEILRVISQLPTDVQPVFETIAANALRLCNAKFSTCCKFDGELIHLAALHHMNPKGAAAFHAAYPCAPSRGGVTQRAILTGGIIHIADVREDREYTYHDAAKAADYRSVLSVPLLRSGQPIGAITVFKAQPTSFPQTQVELLKIFADQAVIAIENARLFKELEQRNDALAESLEQQTATSEILRVISESPTDVRPVFDTIVASVMELCRASSANLLTFDGELLHVAALEVANPDGADSIRRLYPTRIGRHQASARAILTRDVVVIPDILEDDEYTTTEAALAAGFRSIAAVPLMREGSPIGAIVVGRTEAGPFPEKQVALLRTFADQAVIAIQNVRLFNELDARNRDLTEALEQQTATSDILRVISQSPTDAQPVFDTIAAAALKLCNATSAVVTRFDGEMMHAAALANVSPEGAAAVRGRYPRRPGRFNAAGRAVLTCRVVAIPDVLVDPEFDLKPGLLAAGFRSVVAFPLLREGKPMGAITVVRPEPGHFPEKQIALLQTFADQAVIAIENVRLFTELEARNRELTEALEQQTATSDILRVISRSPTDIQPVFDTIAESALSLCGASSANVFTYDGSLVHLAALVNLTPEGADAIRSLWPRPPNRELAAGRAILTRSVVEIPDVIKDADFVPTATKAVAGNFRSIVAVPLMRDGGPIGAIAVGRPEAGAFPDTHVALLKTFADQAVIAIENVRLFNELKARTAELTRSVGELSALGEIGRAVSSTLNLETVLATIVARATELAGLDGGSIWEYDDAHEEFHLHATNRLPDELVAVLRRTPIRKGQGVLGRLAVTREPVVIADIAQERSYPAWLREVMGRFGYRSVLAVPLLREDQLLGALAVNRSGSGGFAPEVVELLKNFATQSALAIQNARLFREIEQKSRELEAASRHKSEFLANMSHELRTPLNAIIGFSEVLSEQMFGGINDKQAEYLKDILESGRHLLSLINDILDLSKIEAGRMELEPSEFDLHVAIENALILVRERANRHGITLSQTIDERLGAVRADERKVKQVLLNLLTNALKFTPEGGKIDVRARLQDGAAEVSVSDTGIGIAQEDQATVFEEFRQVGTASKKVEGTGLGLAISRKFIELHGGTIGVTSKPGMGSTFAFTLPLHSVH